MSIEGELKPMGAAHVAPEEAASNGNGRMREPLGIPDPAEVDVPAELRQRVEELMGRYPQRRSAAIPALWEIQRRDGWCSPEGILQVAAVMEVSPGYLESVASFYDLFRTSPIGRDRILVCTNISCWMRGADELRDAFCDAAGVDREAAAHGGASTADGTAFVSGFECLGACDIAPMASVNERYYGPLVPGDAERIVAALRDGAEVLPEKAIARRPSAGAAMNGGGTAGGESGEEAQADRGHDAAPADRAGTESADSGASGLDHPDAPEPPGDTGSSTPESPSAQESEE